MKYPVIDNRATGVNLRRIMDARDITVKDLKEFLGLSSIQSIYHWLNGICLPSIDNLYAMSIYFGLPMDVLICGRDEQPLGMSCPIICGHDGCSETVRHCNCQDSDVHCPYCIRISSYWHRFNRRIKLLWEHLPESVRPDHFEILALERNQVIYHK